MQKSYSTSTVENEQGAKKGSNDLKDTTTTTAHSNVKSDKKNPLSQFYYNGVESNRKPRLRTSIVEGITKGKKIDDKEERNRSVKYHCESTTKKFLWSGNFHPLRNLGRSSLTVEPDKITISSSKYSPCASRLAASSKILSNDLGANSDSPLHVPRSRSPSRLDVQPAENNLPKNLDERTSMQGSLSLNIQQFLKTKCAPRSKSVDDSCVTSLTSEATTLSYSPTSTEVLSLGEVGQQTSSAEGSASYSEVKEKLVIECSDKVQRASLETKC
ncbi:PREDICTED: uncharacterized protein LOC106791557 [Polistes canadensis]|uniref:uncharacterized protein LOC106791557 n=1 Tax=Polistes canadensis TaxID=91411 RepID=UPI000718E5D1|nr:PREDICTED: uncharacterized protein LOC106791557 [Polistes canadensis]